MKSLELQIYIFVFRCHHNINDFFLDIFFPMSVIRISMSRYNFSAAHQLLRATSYIERLRCRRAEEHIEQKNKKKKSKQGQHYQTEMGWKICLSFSERLFFFFAWFPRSSNVSISIDRSKSYYGF